MTRDDLNGMASEQVIAILEAEVDMFLDLTEELLAQGCDIQRTQQERDDPLEGIYLAGGLDVYKEAIELLAEYRPCCWTTNTNGGRCAPWSNPEHTHNNLTRLTRLTQLMETD